jgi:hypothetical protein
VPSISKRSPEKVTFCGGAENIIEAGEIILASRTIRLLKDCLRERLRRGRLDFEIERLYPISHATGLPRMSETIKNIS